MRWVYAITTYLASTALAVYVDEAGQIDYHHALLGLPSLETTFFHQPSASSKASLIYTFTESGVIGAVNPKDGSIVWRQQIGQRDDATTESRQILRAGENQDTIVCAASQTVSAWSSTDGRSVWQRVVEGPVFDLEVLEMPLSESAKVAKDSVTLYKSAKGSTVQRLDGKTGAVVWTYDEESGDTPYRLAASGTNVNLITYTSSSRGLTLKVTTLDPVTGQKVEVHILSSESDVYSEQDILFVGSNSAARILAWTDSSKNVLKVNILGTSQVGTFDVKQKASEIQRITIHASGRLDSSPHFLVQYNSADAHWAEVYHIDLSTSAITKAYDLPKLQGKGVFTETTVDANVYFVRIADDQTILLNSASHGVLEKWPISSFASRSTIDPVYPVHATSEVVVKSGSSYAVRSAILLSNGNWALIRNGELSWTRPEALADAIKAIFVPSRVEPALIQELEAEAVKDPVSAYLHRLFRHIGDLESLPTWIRGVVQSLLGTAGVTNGERAIVDSFGFNKLVVVATKNDRLIGIETGNHGRVAFNIKGPLDALEYFANADRPEAFGSLLTMDATSIASLEAHVQSAGARVGAKVVQPKSSLTYKVESGSIKGFKDAKLTWELNLEPGQSVLRIQQAEAEEPIASIGKVLGDRRVLYKYLNPNVILVLLKDQVRKELSAYVLDSISGTILHSANHKNVATYGPIASVVSENWFAYSFATDASSEEMSKGYQLVFSELLESDIPDSRGIILPGTNSSTISPSAYISLPYVASQTYLTPYPISNMGVTQTGQGITSRELLLTLAYSNAIVGVPKYILDPRRIVGKAPTNQQLEEGLSQYAPMIDFDPTWYLNHKEELFGIEEIITSSSSLESTSLVFAYGHDVFGTRRSPSFSFDILGNSFNKITLILTVVGLTIGTIFLAPFIARKQTNMFWQNT